MKLRAGVLLVLAFGAATCAHGRVVQAGDAREALEQRQAAFAGAMAARDAGQVASLFAVEGVLHVAGMPPVEGREAIHGFYGKMFGFLSSSRTAVEATHVSAAGDMAYSYGRATNEFRGPQGPVEYPGKYSIVWRRSAGEWVIALYSVSSNQPEGR